MIDFWVSIGSTYSYLSVMRLRVVEEESGVAFRWRPFSVRAIMIEQKNVHVAGHRAASAIARPRSAAACAVSARGIRSRQ